jgi:hypothetical protein
MTDLEHLESLVNGPEEAYVKAKVANHPAKEIAALKRTLDAAYREFERRIANA